MAQIPKPPSGGLRIDVPAPAGTHAAVCLKVIDQFGVERRKFQSQETESQDVTRFLFGVVIDGKGYLCATFESRISGAPNSNLIKLLHGWTGKAPQIGWDYCEMENQGAMITIQDRESGQGEKYSVVSAIAPPDEGMAIPDPKKCSRLLSEALNDDEASAPAQAAQVQGNAQESVPNTNEEDDIPF